MKVKWKLNENVSNESKMKINVTWFMESSVKEFKNENRLVTIIEIGNIQNEKWTKNQTKWRIMNYVNWYNN